jgi:hypothetical protein
MVHCYCSCHMALERVEIRMLIQDLKVVNAFLTDYVALTYVSFLTLRLVIR